MRLSVVGSEMCIREMFKVRYFWVRSNTNTFGKVGGLFEIFQVFDTTHKKNGGKIQKCWCQIQRVSPWHNNRMWSWAIACSIIVIIAKYFCVAGGDLKMVEESLMKSFSFYWVDDGTLGVKIQNLKVDFKTWGTWRQVGQWILIMNIYDIFYST